MTPPDATTACGSDPGTARQLKHAERVLGQLPFLVVQRLAQSYQEVVDLTKTDGMCPEVTPRKLRSIYLRARSTATRDTLPMSPRLWAAVACYDAAVREAPKWAGAGSSSMSAGTNKRASKRVKRELPEVVEEFHRTALDGLLGMSAEEVRVDLIEREQRMARMTSIQTLLLRGLPDPTTGKVRPDDWALGRIDAAERLKARALNDPASFLYQGVESAAQSERRRSHRRAASDPYPHDEIRSLAQKLGWHRAKPRSDERTRILDEVIEKLHIVRGLHEARVRSGGPTRIDLDSVKRNLRRIIGTPGR